MAQTNTTLDNAIDILASFQKRKEVRDNDTGIRAQRLVNIYRHLSNFPKSYIQDFNKQLLEASPEVQMSLSNIIGGNIVRQYVDYLKNKMGQPTGKEEDKNAEYLPEKSYLPSPEDDQLNMNHASFSQSLEGDFHTPINPEPFMNQFFAKQHEESVKQSEFFQKALQQFQEGISHQIQSISEHSLSSKKTHEELQKMQQEIITQTVERIVKLQTEIFTKALSDIIRDTKKSSNHPQDKLSFLQNESDKQYPIIEEDISLLKDSELKNQSLQSKKQDQKNQHKEIQPDKKG